MGCFLNDYVAKALDSNWTHTDEYYGEHSLKRFTYKSANAPLRYDINIVGSRKKFKYRLAAISFFGR